MTSRFEIQKTKIKGVAVLQRLPLIDNRGLLERLYCKRELSPLLNGKSIVQINHTVTKMFGTVRGMHFQNSPFAEIKIINWFDAVLTKRFFFINPWIIYINITIQAFKSDN